MTTEGTVTISLDEYEATQRRLRGYEDREARSGLECARQPKREDAKVVRRGFWLRTSGAPTTTLNVNRRYRTQINPNNLLSG